MDLPKRKQIRLPNYDYSSPGAYFVTVCTEDRRCILSSVCRGDPCGRPSLDVTRYGQIVAQCLRQTEDLFHVRLEPHVIMPNHVHFICEIDGERATTRVAPERLATAKEDGTPTLGQIVGAWKSLSANQCRKAGLTGKLWQRGFYEHVIRSESDYSEIGEYIEYNPAKWAEDRYYESTGDTPPVP